METTTCGFAGLFLALGLALGAPDPAHATAPDELDRARAVEAQLGAQARGNANRMNMLIVLNDDLDTRSFDKLLELDRLPSVQQHIVADGMKFNEAFVTNSLCCPSRASLLTGQYNHNNGVLANGGANGGVNVFQDDSTLATWLRNSGYYTGYIGKYLNGYGTLGETGNPASNSRDERYVPPGWDQWHGLVDPLSYCMYDYKLSSNGVVATYGLEEADYQTDVLAAMALQFLADWRAEAPDKPFFLFINPLAPHDELCADPLRDAGAKEGPSRAINLTVRPAPRHVADAEIYALPIPESGSFNEADISDKPAWLQARHQFQMTQEVIDKITQKYRDRLASMLAVDDMVGALVTELGADYDNTAMIFTSDNGYQMGEHRLTGKEYPYDESLRVPLAIRLPLAPAAASSDRIVLNIDLAPTLLQLAGTSATSGHVIDGRSFAYLYYVNAAANWRHRFLVEHWVHLSNNPVPANYVGVRTDAVLDALAPWQLYVSYEYPSTGASEREHYDMATDPDQTENLFDASNGLTAEQTALEQRVQRLKTCAGDTCRYHENN